MVAVEWAGYRCTSVPEGGQTGDIGQTKRVKKRKNCGLTESTAARTTLTWRGALTAAERELRRHTASRERGGRRPLRLTPSDSAHARSIRSLTHSYRVRLCLSRRRRTGRVATPSRRTGRLPADSAAAPLESSKTPLLIRWPRGRCVTRSIRTTCTRTVPQGPYLDLGCPTGPTWTWAVPQGHIWTLAVPQGPPGPEPSLRAHLDPGRPTEPTRTWAVP